MGTHTSSYVVVNRYVLIYGRWVHIYIARRTGIYGMARVGYVDSFEVYVNTDDLGSIPHFHFRNSKECDKFHTCIKIESPEYFHHTGKEGILNSSMKKSLQNFMESPVNINKHKDKFSNNCELVCFLWDINNSSKKKSFRRCRTA